MSNPFPAWLELSEHDYRRVWDRFDDAFAFRPSVSPDDWPAFREPYPSVTWRISELLAAFNTWSDPEATPYNLALLAALKACVPPGEPVLALDWQHAAYEFYPHRLAHADDVTNWRIPALPSAEYHIFVTADHRLGSLGHPWEQTVCVFGKGFLEAYRAQTPLRPDGIIRRNLTPPPLPKASRDRRRTRRPGRR